MKSKWLPTMPLHAANWLADPRVQMLGPVAKSNLLEALLRSWMLGRPVVVDAEIAESYGELWPEYEQLRDECHRNYERRVQQTAAARAARHLGGSVSVTETDTEPVTESVTDDVTDPVTQVKVKVRVKDRVKEPRRKKNTLCSAAPNGDGFESFWAAYPRRQAKQDAVKAWSKIAPDEVEAILAGVERQRDCEQWRRGFVPLPATFLNNRRWEDEVFASAVVPMPGRAPTAAESTRDATERALEKLGAL